MEIDFSGEYVTGKCNLDTTDMVCVPSKPHYNEVDLCLKSDGREGMNVAFCTINTKALSFEEKKKLGYEIERRWNELARLQQENKQLQLKNKELVEAVNLLKSGIRNSINCHWLKRQELFGIHHCSGCSFGLICPDSLIKDRSVKSE